jgi:8-oxo-dGTP pyrophosphatase MutT (NUDIX family)
VEIVSIKTISSREVYRNPWTSVREDVIERANGVRGIYGVVDKDPASIIIPLDVTAEGEFVYLIEQFRYTVGARHRELPQGGWETAEVVPEEMARGELKEETGLTAERMTLLSTLQIAYGGCIGFGGSGEMLGDCVRDKGVTVINGIKTDKN